MRCRRDSYQSKRAYTKSPSVRETSSQRGDVVGARGETAAVSGCNLAENVITGQRAVIASMLF